MRWRGDWSGGGKWLFIAACSAGALLLVAAALTAQRPAGDEVDRAARNDKVAAALEEMEAGEGDDGAESTGGPNGENFGQTGIVSATPDVGNSASQPVPGEPEAVGSGSVDAATEACPGDGRLDINRATAAELETLPGIGPAKSGAIVDDRTRRGRYGKADDLIRVKGIGQKLLSGLKESVVACP